MPMSPVKDLSGEPTVRPIWVDTHCHLDYLGTAEQIAQALSESEAENVQVCIVPAVQVQNFERVQTLAHQYPGVFYTLGIHPLYVLEAHDHDLQVLEKALDWAQHDPKCVGVGEIGLDGFVPHLQTAAAQARQLTFFTHQLALAEHFQLPVILHTRKMLDTVLKYLRKTKGIRGVCHAFNGSFQQAQMVTDLGLKLGAGGAMTYARALQIRRLVAQIPIEHWVLETDAPDIPPAWLESSEQNTPKEIAQIAQIFAELQQTSTISVMQPLLHNTLEVFTRLRIPVG